MTKKPDSKSTFEYVYFVIPKKGSNESIGIDSESVGGTETNTAWRQPEGFKQKVKGWLVTLTQLETLRSMQQGNSEKQFTVFIQRTKDGPFRPYKPKSDLVSKKPVLGITSLLSKGIVTMAVPLPKIFYVTTRDEKHNYAVKDCAKEHDLEKKRMSLGGERSIKRLVFFTPFEARMLAFLRDKTLTSEVKADLLMYTSTPNGPPTLCNSDFSPIEQLSKSVN